MEECLVPWRKPDSGLRLAGGPAKGVACSQWYPERVFSTDFRLEPS